MNCLNSKKLYRGQNGIVSILVVSILTVTLSLIAIGFSRLANRELRQASDRELSSQAYYAAQSGLNDAIAYIAAGGVGFPGCAVPTSEPAPSAQPPQYFSPDLSATNASAKYSCIRIDTQPTELFTPVSPGQPQILKVSTGNIKNMYIAWQNTNNSTNWLPAGNKLPAEDSALGSVTTGVLRVGLYEVPNSAACNTNNCLSGHSSVYYLYPRGGGGPITAVTYASGRYNITTGPSNPNGNFENGKCRTSPLPNPVPTPDSRPQYCNVEIKGLDGVHNTYYLYLTAQYSAVNVSVQGNDGGTPPHPVNFIKSQATVDVTGQGSGVIQRIQAKVDLGNNFGLPNYAVQSMETLCKNFTIQILAPIGGVWQYGSAMTKENPDSSCYAPSGNGNIISPTSDLYPNGH